MKKILGVIPARGGSKGVKQKNKRLLKGRPLIEYAIVAAQKSLLIEKLIVSTDDAEISNIARKLGVEIPFVRPEFLATDNVSLVDVSRHALDFFDNIGWNAEAVLSFQPTCPFIRSETIDEVIKLFISSNCDSVTTVAEIKQGHPYIAKRLESDNSIRDFCSIPKGAVVSPRQKREKAYYLTGGIYLRSRHLLESDSVSGHCLGNDARSVIVNEIEAIDINIELDFKFAEFLINEGIVKI